MIFGSAKTIDNLTDLQRQRDELLTLCWAAHKSLTMARTCEHETEAIKEQQKAEDLLWNAITKVGANLPIAYYQYCTICDEMVPRSEYESHLADYHQLTM